VRKSTAMATPPPLVLKRTSFSFFSQFYEIILTDQETRSIWGRSLGRRFYIGLFFVNRLSMCKINQEPLKNHVCFFKVSAVRGHKSHTQQKILASNGI